MSNNVSLYWTANQNPERLKSKKVSHPTLFIVELLNGSFPSGEILICHAEGTFMGRQFYWNRTLKIEIVYIEPSNQKPTMVLSYPKGQGYFGPRVFGSNLLFRNTYSNKICNGIFTSLIFLGKRAKYDRI